MINIFRTEGDGNTSIKQFGNAFEIKIKPINNFAQSGGFRFRVEWREELSGLVF